MLQGILIVVAFLVVAALMMTKKIPTLLALPLMAVVICIIAGVPMFGKNADGAEIGWLTTVFEAGTVRMGSAIMATIFGAWLGQLMNKTGVTENIIKKSAELGVRSVGPVNGNAVPLCSQIGAVLLCHIINSFCGWHPRPCPAGCRVVSTLATGSSSGGVIQGEYSTLQ